MNNNKEITYEMVYRITDHGRWNGTSIASRTWDKVDRRGDDECWEWQGSRNQDGRGMVCIDGVWTISVPRLIWFLVYEEWPGELFVCHKCDNPPCCNPRHLFLGDNSENIKDMYVKGRRIAYRGEEVANAKLTNEQALLIRQLYVPRTNERRLELAEMFHVSDATIQGVVYNRRYL